MLDEVRFSVARQNFTEIIDRIQDFESVLIKKRKKSEIDAVILNRELFEDFLDDVKFSLEITEEETGEFTIVLNELNIIGAGENRDEAIDDLANEVMLYSEDYIKNYNMYRHASNRKDHLKQVLKIALLETEEEVKSVLLAGELVT